MNQQGFSLVECMVYCMVLGVLFTTWFHGMVLSQIAFAKVGKHTMQLSNLYAAHDALVRDIRQAPTVPNQWKKNDRTEIIWHANNKDIGWQVYKDALIRVEGTYDAKNHLWHNKKQSVALLGVKQIIFSEHRIKDLVHLIAYELTLTDNQQFKAEILLNNGVING